VSEEQLKAKATESNSSWRRWLNTLGPLLALLLVYMIFAVIAPASFRTARNLEMIGRQTTIVAMAALGMTLVIISGGIDLSVGSVVALSTIVIAWILQRSGISGALSNIGWGWALPWIAAMTGIAAGALRIYQRDIDNAAKGAAFYSDIGNDVSRARCGQGHRAGAENRRRAGAIEVAG
jgi:ABC-type xylose transport system permease subunit